LTNSSLAQAYLKKAVDRLEILDMLHKKKAFSDVVREAQEIVELALKGMLRSIGVEPPHFHDVGGFLLEHRERFPERVRTSLDRCAQVSKWLRKERELSFYGDIDFLPTEQYDSSDSQRAKEDAYWVVGVARKAITG
jgi:HEPN domain-containing protein